MLEIDPLKVRDSRMSRVLGHDYDRGPLLILAGPGTGKTYSLLETIRTQLMNEYSLGDFFEATLTNAAANDFLADARIKISEEFDSSSTIHHRAKGILHTYAGVIGLNPGFTVIDENCEDLIHSDLRSILNQDLNSFLQSLKGYRKLSANAHSSKDDFSMLYKKIQSFYSALDWFNVVFLACRLLQDHKEIRAEESNRFRFLLIDEYQDLNPTDQLFVELLLDGRGTLLAVGDDDQSIYSGRFADPSGIGQFKNRYPSGRVLQLPVTSRLSSAVIAAAYSIISRNVNRIQKDRLMALSETEVRAKDGFVISVNNKSDKAEKQFIHDALLTLIEANIPPKEILVLCSCRALGLELIEDLRVLDQNGRISISNELEKGIQLGREEYLLNQLIRFVSNPNDNLAARMIINEIALSYSEEQLAIVRFAFESNTSIWHALEDEELIDQIGQLEPILDELRHHLEDLGPDTDTLIRVRQLIGSFKPLSHLAEYLPEEFDIQGVSKIPVTTQEPLGVRFITLHSSKGLDGDFVFIPFLEEAIGLHGEDLEEKRRLLYVGITRAKIGVVMTWAWSRRSDKRFKCSGDGGAPTKRNPIALIGEAGIAPNLVPLYSDQQSSDVALELLLHHSQDLLYE